MSERLEEQSNEKKKLSIFPSSSRLEVLCGKSLADPSEEGRRPVLLISQSRGEFRAMGIIFCAL